MYINCEILLPSTLKKKIYSLLKHFPGTINFCTYTCDQVLPNDQQFHGKYIVVYCVQQETSVVIYKLWANLEILLMYNKY